MCSSHDYKMWSHINLIPLEKDDLSVSQLLIVHQLPADGPHHTGNLISRSITNRYLKVKDPGTLPVFIVGLESIKLLICKKDLVYTTR